MVQVPYTRILSPKVKNHRSNLAEWKFVKLDLKKIIKLPLNNLKNNLKTAKTDFHFPIILIFSVFKYLPILLAVVAYLAII